MNQIIISGHGQGGSVAALAALAVATMFPCQAYKIKLLTYGSPKLGDTTFVQYFALKVPLSVRYVTSNSAEGDDIYTTVGTGIDHVGKSISLTCATFSKRASTACHIAPEYLHAILVKHEGRQAFVNLRPLATPSDCNVTCTSTLIIVCSHL